MSERCKDCDLPLATTADYLDTEEGECPNLCWRNCNDDRCMSETDPSRKVDWRSRAESFERAARHWAEAYARECARPDEYAPGLLLPAGALEWLRDGERGASSEAIFAHLTGVNIGQFGTFYIPVDSGDFRRCRLLLEAVPAFAADFKRMSEVSPSWATLVSNWDELCASMDEEHSNWRIGQGGCPITYRKLNEVLDRIPRRP